MIPVSRKITFLNFRNNFDVAYCSHNSKSKYLLYNNKIYTIQECKELKSSYSEKEYIIHGSCKKSYNNYSHEEVYEFDSLPTLSKITVFDITNLSNYYTKDEAINLIDKSKLINLAVCDGSAITMNDISLSIKINDALEFPFSGIIDRNTEIVIDLENTNSNKIVKEILEIDEFNIIEFSISFLLEENKHKSSTSITKYKLVHNGENFSYEPFLDEFEKMTCHRLLKTELFDLILSYLENKRFGTADIFTIENKNIKYKITIDYIESYDQNVAFTFLNKSIIKSNQLRITSNEINLQLFDQYVNLTCEDTIVFNISYSDSSTLLYDELKEEILSKLEEISFVKHNIFNLYVYNENDIPIKVTVVLSDIVTKILYARKCIYYLKENTNVCLKFNDNHNMHYYVLKKSEVSKVKNVSLKLSKNSLDQITVNITDLTLKIKSLMPTCLFINRTIIIDEFNVKITIETLNYDDNSDPFSHILGIFSEAEITINKASLDSSLHIIDDSYGASRSINIDVIKNLAKNMEEEGIGGMTNHVNKIIRDVLITRTNMLDNNIISYVKPSKGIMLYGPPGVGKTTFAKNIASLLGCSGSRLKLVSSGSELFSKWFGQSEENIKNLFAPAMKSFESFGNHSPLHVVIIDEIDSILSKRKGDEANSLKDSIVNEFLGLMDGLYQSNNIIIIGITNRLELIDPAALRPGRFGCCVKVDYPDFEQRKNIFRIHHKKFNKSNIITNLDYNILAGMTENFSGADIEDIFSKCLGKYIDYAMNNNNEKKLMTQDDVIGIINEDNKKLDF